MSKPVYETALKASESDASYENPPGLRNLGTIGADKCVCSYLTRNKAINGGACLWAPANEQVVYANSSENSPTAYSWYVPGGEPERLTTQDAAVVYRNAGVYDFPTLEVTTKNGTSSYKSDKAIKTGGTAEITCSDMSEWLTTYALGQMPFSDGGGWLGGTNSKDLVGYGNLFMTAQPASQLESVNVYLPSKPTKYKDGATLRMQIWYPSISENDIVFTGIPLDGAIISMADIKDASDGAYVPVQGGAVAQFKLASPLDMEGKPMFFVSIDGFSNDPSTEDFCILFDFMGKNLTDEEAASLLSHNSFVRYKGESDYLRPVASYGGGYGSFLICPVMTDLTTSTSIGKPLQTEGLDVSFRGNTLSVKADGCKRAYVYSVEGVRLAVVRIENGEGTAGLGSSNGGVLIVKTDNGKAVKITRK